MYICMYICVMYSYPNSMIRLASSPGGLKMALPLLDMDEEWEGEGAGEGEKEGEIGPEKPDMMDEDVNSTLTPSSVESKADATDAADGDDALAFTSSLSSFLNPTAINSTTPDSFEITTVKNTLSHVIQSPPSPSPPYDPLPVTTGGGVKTPMNSPTVNPLTYKRPTQPWKNNFNISKTDNVKYILQQQNENFKRYKSNQLTEAIFHTYTKLKLMTERFPTSSSTSTSTTTSRRVVQPYSKGEIQSALYHFMKVAYCVFI